MIENKYNLIANSKLHDYKLCDINVSYNKAMINMFLNNSKGKEVIINFEDFSVFKISHEEKWGMGTYICSSSVESDAENLGYSVEIELNSGDLIQIKCNKIV